VANWQEVLKEISTEIAVHQQAAQSAVDTIRRKYLKELHSRTGRHVIAYYSAFLSKPEITNAEINDEDKNGFMMAVHGLTAAQRNDGLDLILHTPGGSIAATESLVDYLRRMFGKNIRAIVPQIAMSAGTMIACSCSEILMARHANLGPIDPHLRGMPAYGVLSEFRKAGREIQKDASKRLVWQPILAQYPPAFLGQCANAIRWSNEFVGTQLEGVMFASLPPAEAKKKAQEIVKKLASFPRNKTHNRHIHYDECKALDLKVALIEDDQNLQDVILPVHHCFMHTLMNTDAYKIIENDRGAALVKRQQTFIVKK
jgi:membrane-bound ClpP family serine protease